MPTVSIPKPELSARTIARASDFRASAVTIPEPELSGPALARALDVQASTVRWWKRNGAPCIIYNAKLIRYRLSEIQTWLREGKPKSQTVTPPSAATSQRYRLLGGRNPKNNFCRRRPTLGEAKNKPTKALGRHRPNDPADRRPTT
jgi:hypothetical protein